MAFPNVWGAHGPGIGPYSAIRLGDWKLIDFLPEQRFELYKVSQDVGGTQNLVAQQPQIASRLAHLLQQKLQAENA